MSKKIIVFFLMFFSQQLLGGYHSDRGENNINYLDIESYQGVLIENWAGNVSFTPDKIFYPKSKAEVERIVRDAGEKGLKISIIGKGHSWSPLAHGSDYLVSTKELRQIEIDKENLQVTVESGATIADVDEALEAEGLVFSCNVVGTSDLTYGGLMATGSHGSGRNCGVMSDYIVSMDIIGSDGETVVYSEDTVGVETMKLARVNLGLLGFIHKITFRVEPDYNVLVTDRYVTMDNLFSELKKSLASQDAVEVMWFPHTDKALIKSRVRTSLPLPEPGRFDDLRSRVSNELFEILLNYGVMPLMQYFPATTPFVIRNVSSRLFPESTYVSDINTATHYYNEAHRYPINESEIAIPYGDDDFSQIKKGWFAMVNQVKEDQDNGLYRLNIIVHMRFIGNSTSIMSPSWENKKTCYMDFGSFVQTPGWKSLSNSIWKTWKTIPGVQLHWAKDMLNFDGIDARDMYGEDRIEKFLALRKQADPVQMFTNQYLKQLLRIED